jgi:hypothetical protein
MALVLADRVQQTGTANTTVSFTFSGTVSGYQAFTVIGNANTTYYGATDTAGNWEVGIGTYTLVGTLLTRNTILSSSNAGAAVTFSGTVTVFVTYPSSRSIYANGTTLTATNSSILPVASGGTGVATLTGLAYGNATSAFSAATAAQVVSVIGTTAVTNATNASNLTGGNITGNYSLSNTTSPNTVHLQFGDNSGWIYRFMTNVAGTPTTRFSFTDSGNFTAVGTVAGTNITSAGNVTGTSTNVTGVVAAANGGTGQSSYAVGDLVYASTTTALSKLADVATGNALISGGVGVAPSYGKIGLTTHVSGTLPIANGGTNGTATPTLGGVIVGTGTAYASTAAGTTGQVLLAQTGAAPVWGSAPASGVTSLAGTANQITASASTGAVTLSTPSTFIAPGSIAATTTVTGTTINASQPFIVNSKTATVSYSIPSGSSAMSAGPITLNAGVVITVPSGSKWVVL